jgi:hypothetical protein
MDPAARLVGPTSATSRPVTVSVANAVEFSVDAVVPPHAVAVGTVCQDPW